MGLVVYALKFRVTFYVMPVLILLAGIGGCRNAEGRIA
jgi:hypothetical protein